MAKTNEEWNAIARQYGFKDMDDVANWQRTEGRKWGYVGDNDGKLGKNSIEVYRRWNTATKSKNWKSVKTKPKVETAKKTNTKVNLGETQQQQGNFFSNIGKNIKSINTDEILNSPVINRYIRNLSGFVDNPTLEGGFRLLSPISNLIDYISESKIEKSEKKKQEKMLNAREQDPNKGTGYYITFDNYRPDIGDGTKPYAAGHAGALITDNQGNYQYIDYGRYGNGTSGKKLSSKEGNFRTQNNSNLEFSNIIDQIRKFNHYDGPISVTTVPNIDYNGAIHWLDSVSNDPNRVPYSLKDRNCGTVAYDLLNENIQGYNLPTVVRNNTFPIKFTQTLKDNNYESQIFDNTTIQH